MAQGKRKVSVNIFGESYIVLGNEDQAHIEGLAVLLDRKMRLISQRNPRLTTTKVAVLAALNFADELAKLKQEHRAVTKVLDAEKEL
ncbi:MAG: cell division protein ZapA [Peptococcaceae bacterium]|nr:cell division protein ZapA [Peptococcaceae bacterium]